MEEKYTIYCIDSESVMQEIADFIEVYIGAFNMEEAKEMFKKNKHAEIAEHTITIEINKK
jgi:hypothetical protein